MKTRKNLLFITIGVLAGCMLLAYTHHLEEKKLRALSVIDELQTRLKSVAGQESQIQPEKISIRWDNGDGYTIRIPPTESFLIAKPEEGCSFERHPALSLFHRETAIAQRVFTERGFILSPINSSADIADERLYDYVQSYTKGDNLCAVKVNPDCSSHPGISRETHHRMSISCGNTYTKARKQQIPFLEALELRNANTIVRLTKQSGQFFRISISGTRGGGYAILKKEGDKYRTLLISQEAPACSLVEKEQIPSEIVCSCIDETNADIAYREWCT